MTIFHRRVLLFLGVVLSAAISACSDSKSVNQIVNPACNLIGNCENPDPGIPATPDALPMTGTLKYTMTDATTGAVIDTVEATATGVMTSADGVGAIVQYRGQAAGGLDETTFISAEWRAMLSELGTHGPRVFESPIDHTATLVRSRGVEVITRPSGTITAIVVEDYDAMDAAATAGDFANAVRLSRRSFDASGRLVREVRDHDGKPAFILDLLPAE